MQAEEIIKAFFKVLFILAFGFNSQLLLLVLVFAVAGFTPAFLKDTLVASHVYTIVEQKIQEATASEDASTDDMVLPFIKEEFTAQYLQTKSEKLIDDTYSWMNGSTTTPPVLSFKELKTAIEEKNPELVAQIQEAATEMKKQQQSAPQDGSTEQMPDFTKILNSDFTIPIGEKLGPLKQIYATLKVALPVLFVILAVLLGLIALLSSPLKSRLRWIGGTFIFALLSCALPLVVAFNLSQNPVHFATSTDALANILPTIGSSVLQSFADKYLLVELSAAAIFIIATIVCFVIAQLTGEPTQVAKPTKTTNRKKR